MDNVTNKKLVLTFKNAAGKPKTLVIPKYKQPLDATKIQQAMTAVVTGGIFVDQNGQQKFVTPVSAEEIITESKTIIDLKTTPQK